MLQLIKSCLFVSTLLFSVLSREFFNSFALFLFSLDLPQKPGAFTLWILPFLPRLTVDIFYIIKLVGFLKKGYRPRYNDVIFLYLNFNLI
jgi:hypothetical protein